MNPEDYKNIMEQFFTRLSNMSGDLGVNGRGHSPVPGSKSNKSGINKKVSAEEQKRLDLLTKLNKRLAAGKPLADAELKLLKESNSQLEGLQSNLKNVNKEYDGSKGSIKSFFSGILDGGNNVGSAFGTLGKRLSTSGDATTKALGGIAMGAGYVLGGLQEFAKGAADMGSFADLSSFSVGSVTQMKILSGLGASFIKVIEGSQGGFRAFGSTSEEAAKNLSNLSRGLKYGANATTMWGWTLSKDVAKNMDRASNAAAAMGLSDEARANLMGSLAQSSSLAALNEADAQKKLVKQYADTLDNTRKLSNAFGVSSTEILKAMADFRSSQAGQVASLAGNTSAQNLVPLIKSLGIENDPTKIADIALALSKGDLATARLNLSNQSANPILEKLAESIQSGGAGGANMDAITQNLKTLSPELRAIAEQRIAMQGKDNLYAAPGVTLATALKRLEQGGKITDQATTGTSEADNIKSMNSLVGSLDYLRWAVVSLTAVISSMGITLALIAGGIGGGVLSKATGAAGIFGSLKDGLAGVFDKIATTTGWKKAGAVAGTATGWKAGATAAGEVGSAAGNIGGAAGGLGNLGKSLASIGKGAGAGLIGLLKGLGTGIGGAIGGVLKGIASGLMAFANPAVLGGAVILGASIAAIGAGAGVAIWALGAALPGFAKGLSDVAAVDGSALISIGLGLAALGAGLAVFSTAKLFSGITGVIGNVITLGGLLSGDSPLDMIKKLAKDATNISLVGQGIKNFGDGLLAVNAGLADFNTDALKNFRDQIVEFAAAGSSDEMRLTAQYLTSIGSSLTGINNLSDMKLPSVGNLTTPNVSTNMAPVGQATNALDLGLNSSSISPELIGRVLAYLASIENDLQAIRGNTRSNGDSSTVRLT